MLNFVFKHILRLVQYSSGGPLVEFDVTDVIIAVQDRHFGGVRDGQCCAQSGL